MRVADYRSHRKHPLHVTVSFHSAIDLLILLWILGDRLAGAGIKDLDVGEEFFETITNKLSARTARDLELIGSGDVWIALIALLPETSEGGSVSDFVEFLTAYDPADLRYRLIQLHDLVDARTLFVLGVGITALLVARASSVGAATVIAPVEVMVAARAWNFRDDLGDLLLQKREEHFSVLAREGGQVSLRNRAGLRLIRLGDGRAAFVDGIVAVPALAFSTTPENECGEDRDARDHQGCDFTAGRRFPASVTLLFKPGHLISDLRASNTSWCDSQSRRLRPPRPCRGRLARRGALLLLFERPGRGRELEPGGGLNASARGRRDRPGPFLF